MSHSAPIKDVYEQAATVLGRLVIAFGDLEIALGGALMRLLKQEERVGVVLGGLINFSKKIELLRALSFKIDNDDVRADFDELVTKAEEINSERNRLLHAEYSATEDDNTLTGIMTRRLRDMHKLYTADGASLKNGELLNEEEIMDVANDASQLASTILKFSEQFNPGGD